MVMRVGMEMRRISQGAFRAFKHLQRLLTSFYRLFPHPPLVAFCTPFNRSLIEPLGDAVIAYTLPHKGYHAEVDRLAVEHRLDVLVRTLPGEEKLSFPLERQVFLLTEPPACSLPDSSPSAARSDRLGLTQVLGAGAIVVTSCALAEALQREQVLDERSITLIPADGAVRAAEMLHQICQKITEAPPPAKPAGPLTPLVSIVTPSFNQARYLGRTIDSVLAQTYPHIEYRVLDGGSTDGSLDVLRSYGDRVEWSSGPDRGQTDAINKGLGQSRGSIRAYLNSDDVLLPHAVERAVEHFLRHPECDVVYGRARYLSDDDRVLHPYITMEYSFASLMERCCICQPATFWRTRIAERVGGFDESLDFAMDLDYWLRIDRAGGRIEHVPEELALTRVHPETKSKSARREVLAEVFAVCQRHGGHVHMHYFRELWYHLCKERPTGWPRWVGLIPGARQSLAWLHHLWWNRRQYAPQAMARWLVEQGRYWLVHTSWLRPVVAPVRRLYGALLRPWLPLPLGEDNWLGPSGVIDLPEQSADQVWRLTGAPCDDMQLTVRAGRQCVGVWSLRRGRSEQVQFRVPSGVTRARLRFSRSQFLDGRRISFRVEQTNLFPASTGG
jgi:glycosyltransferase involved in cell wall biosynthesis